MPKRVPWWMQVLAALWLAVMWCLGRPWTVVAGILAMIVVGVALDN